MVVGAVDTVDNRRPGWSRRAARCALPVGAGRANRGRGVDGPAVPTRFTQATGGVVRRFGAVIHSCPQTFVDNCEVVALGLSAVEDVLWRNRPLDVHMVIHNQWTTSEMSGSCRTGLEKVTLCTQLWTDLWTHVHARPGVVWTGLGRRVGEDGGPPGCQAARRRAPRRRGAARADRRSRS